MARFGVSSDHAGIGISGWVGSYDTQEQADSVADTLTDRGDAGVTVEPVKE